jgi:aubergine
MYSCINE